MSLKAGVLNPDVMVPRLQGFDRVEIHPFSHQIPDAQSHNEMFSPDSGSLLLLSSGMVLAPSSLGALLDDLKRPGIGIVEPRLLPVESSREFDSESGEVGWASLNAMAVASGIFEELGGFGLLGLGVEDVDFSWRASYRGEMVVRCQRASVFDRCYRLKSESDQVPSISENEVVAFLALAKRHGRPDLVDSELSRISDSGTEEERRGVTRYKELAIEALGEIAPSSFAPYFGNSAYSALRFEGPHERT